MTVTVDPTAYEAASRVFGSDLAQLVASAAASVSDGLAGLRQMAGSDPAGASWADGYDQAAQQTVQLLDDLRRGCVTVGALLQQSGYNHARAEAYSDVSGSGVDVPDTTSYDPGPGQCVAGPPTAAGGTVYPPHGWDELTRWCGAVWPDGDPGKLRTAASVWRTAAGTLDSGQQLVTDGTATVTAQSAPEVDAAYLVCRSLGTSLSDAADQCRALASACDDMADHVDDAHTNLIHEVEQFIEITLTIEVAGAVIGMFTAGIGEAAAQVGEAGEIAGVVARVATILDRLAEAAKTVTSRICIPGLDATTNELRAILIRSPRLAQATPVVKTTEALEDIAARLRTPAPWADNPSARGFAVERIFRGNLPNNFPVIDKWDEVRGIATSVKSIDLGAKTYQKASGLRAVLKDYIGKLADFEEASYSKVDILPGEVTSKVLEVGIPRGASAEQQAVFAEMKTYATERGITLVVRVV